jgi:putative transposase
MPQSLAKVLLHLVYSTKNRAPLLADPDLRRQLFAYKAAILRDNVDSPGIVIGGVADHIHALILLSRKFAIMKVVEEAKTETTKWLKLQAPELRDFAWQAGYGAFSVSESNGDAVKRYIETQEERHERQTYQDESTASYVAATGSSSTSGMCGIERWARRRKSRRDGGAGARAAPVGL